MKKVFLDVGGFEGESVRAALDPIFAFDAVYCFEPVKSCAESIAATIRDRRLKVIPAGLLDSNCTLSLGNPGDLGGSIYSQENTSEPCAFIRASDFFSKNISAGDQVWMKLNCEGAELGILNDLLDSDEASKIHEVLVDLDAARFPQLHAAAETLLERLKHAPFSYHFPPEVQYGAVNNFGGIHQWLRLTGATSKSIPSRLASAWYNIRYAFDRRFNGYHKIRLLRFLRLRPPPVLASPDDRDTWSPIHRPRGPFDVGQGSVCRTRYHRRGDIEVHWTDPNT